MFEIDVRQSNEALTKLVTPTDCQDIAADPLRWIVAHCPSPRELSGAVADIARPTIEADLQQALGVPMDDMSPARHVGRVFTYSVTPRRNLDPEIPWILCAPAGMIDALAGLARLLGDYLQLNNNVGPQHIAWSERAMQYKLALVRAAVGQLTKAELAFLLHQIDAMRNKALRGTIWPAPSSWNKYVPVLALGFALLVVGGALFVGTL